MSPCIYFTIVPCTKSPRNEYKRVERHKNFYCIAAANTYGQGADRQYIGRNQLDAASLDRFVFLDWSYDENLESELAGNQDWSDHVQKIRAFVDNNKIRHVVSPRASIFGAKLLACGIEKEIVETIVIWKGLDEATIQKIKQNIEPRQEILSPISGKFTPSVDFNTWISKGSKIGRVESSNNHWNNQSKDIVCPVNGIVTFIERSGYINEEDLIAEIRLKAKP